ncbi:unknown [Odoribacter laneus CAG:561]|nr:unknown [Odoribacter laneus CAG:561]
MYRRSFVVLFGNRLWEEIGGSGDRTESSLLGPAKGNS